MMLKKEKKTDFHSFHLNAPLHIVYRFFFLIQVRPPKKDLFQSGWWNHSSLSARKVVQQQHASPLVQHACCNMYHSICVSHCLGGAWVSGAAQAEDWAVMQGFSCWFPATCCTLLSYIGGEQDFVLYTYSSISKNGAGKGDGQFPYSGFGQLKISKTQLRTWLLINSSSKCITVGTGVL